VSTPVRVIPYTTALPASSRRSSSTHREDGFRILFVGRLVERKGVSHLVEAVRRLPARLDARLDIVGDGPERAHLASIIERDGLGGRVVLRGRVPQGELEAAYDAAQVVVLPSIVDARSDTEGLGVVLLEAMSRRVPVIGSALGGITDIIVDGQTGILVPPGDAAALSTAIAQLADDRPLAERLGDAGYHHAHTNFSWDAIVQRWEECYAAAARTRTGTATPGGPGATPPRATVR
jgi:glycosyltransferase involved in cell wall biosynthesis